MYSTRHAGWHLEAAPSRNLADAPGRRACGPVRAILADVPSTNQRVVGDVAPLHTVLQPYCVLGYPETMLGTLSWMSGKLLPFLSPDCGLSLPIWRRFREESWGGRGGADGMGPSRQIAAHMAPGRVEDSQI